MKPSPRPMLLLSNPRGVDTNRDGILQPDEIHAAATRQYAHMDGNSDGTVTQAAVVEARLALASSLDTDGDRGVSRRELRTHLLDLRRR